MIQAHSQSNGDFEEGQGADGFAVEVSRTIAGRVLDLLAFTSRRKSAPVGLAAIARSLSTVIACRVLVTIDARPHVKCHWSIAASSGHRLRGSSLVAIELTTCSLKHNSGYGTRSDPLGRHCYPTRALRQALQPASPTARSTNQKLANPPMV